MFPRWTELFSALEFMVRRQKARKTAPKPVRRRYASHELLTHFHLFRGVRSENGRLPADVAFFAVEESMAELYGRVYVFEPLAPIKLFVMNLANLTKILRDNPDDVALARAVRGVTGAGTKESWARYRNWNSNDTAEVPFRTIGWTSPDVLHVYTNGFLSPSNRNAEIYASKRLALELRRLLQPLGYGGWTYFKGHYRHTGTPFHGEVMLWAAPSRVRLVAEI